MTRQEIWRQYFALVYKKEIYTMVDCARVADGMLEEEEKRFGTKAMMAIQSSEPPPLITFRFEDLKALLQAARQAVFAREEKPNLEAVEKALRPFDALG